MAGHMPIVFDSAALDERDRFGFAREEYGRKALNVDLEAGRDQPFRLRLRAREFGGVRVAIIESTPYRVPRTKPLTADGDDRLGHLVAAFHRSRSRHPRRRHTAQSPARKHDRPGGNPGVV